MAKNAPQSKQQKKGKTQPEQQVLDSEIFVYENLPFKPSQVGEFFPITKRIEYHSRDANYLVQQGRIAAQEGEPLQAFDLYNQAVSVLMQITGPINVDIASHIQKMSNIQYKLGDNLTAIELLTKSIIIKEKILGFDHPQVAYSYSNLGLYYHTTRYFKKGFECMQKSLRILQNVAGFNHPDISNIFINLGMMYQDADKLQDAVTCYK